MNSVEQNGPAPDASGINIHGFPLNDVLRAFLGENIGYYRPVFLRMERQGAKFHANFVALFFTPIWLAYRKLYIGLMLYFLPPVLVFQGIWSLTMLSPGVIIRLLVVGPFTVSVVFCAFGNYWLYRRFRRVITDPKTSPDQILARVSGGGGGSSAALTFGVLITVVILGAYPALAIFIAMQDTSSSLQ